VRAARRRRAASRGAARGMTNERFCRRILSAARVADNETRLLRARNIPRDADGTESRTGKRSKVTEAKSRHPRTLGEPHPGKLLRKSHGDAGERGERAMHHDDYQSRRRAPETQHR